MAIRPSNSRHTLMPAFTDEERERIKQQSHPVHGDLASIDPRDVSRLFDECHGLMHPERNAHTRSLEILCQDVAVIRNVVCGGDAAFRLVEASTSSSPADPCHSNIANLIAAIVDTYFDANNCSNTKDDAISMLLEDANVNLLAKARRLACQVIVNACSSSAQWRIALATRLFPKRYTCLALTDDVRVVGSLAYSLHTMINLDELDLAMEDLVQLIALMLQVEARYAHETDAKHVHVADASLEILLTHLCFKRGALGDVVSGLCFGEGVDAQNALKLNSNHAHLFDALVAGASNDASPLPDAALSYLHSLIKQIWPAGDHGEENVMSTNLIVLRNCLHLWRDAMANDSTVVSAATVSATIPTLLDMLRRDALIADVLSVIANACHRRPDFQECLLETKRNNEAGATSGDTNTPSPAAHDTLCLILSHARGNPDAPLAREWALLTIRNLCECSQEARDAIEALEKIDASPGSDQTRNAGHSKYKVEYDGGAGGWKLGIES